MLTVNRDVQDRLINGQIGVVKHIKIIENKVSIKYTKFNDPDAGKNWLPRIVITEFITGFQLRQIKLHLSSETQINQ